MRVFKLRKFARIAKRSRIDDAALREVVADISAGRFDAALGSEVYKRRVAREGEGRSGGFRVILAFRAEHRTIFIEMFAKNELENISPATLKTVREAAVAFLGVSDAQADGLVERGDWLEVIGDGQG